MKLMVFALVLLVASVGSALFFTMDRSSAKKEYQQCVQAGGQIQMTDLATCTWPDSDSEISIEL